MNPIMTTYGRIYKTLPLGKLLRLKLFFLNCKFPIVVQNLNNVYKIASKVFGSNFVNKCIEKTYGDIFLAGESTEELENSMSQLRDKGLITIADYAREFLTKEEERTDMGAIIKQYKESIDSSTKVDKRNSIALKISSFINTETLVDFNSIQYALTILEEEILKGTPTEQILKILKEKKIEYAYNLTTESLEIFRENCKFPFALNLFEIVLGGNKEMMDLIQKSFLLSNEDFEVKKDYIKKLDERLIEVFNHTLSRQCLIMVDAEQSYLRYISDYIVAYYFKKLNKDHCVVAQTLQCYLKTQQDDLLKWNLFCRMNNLKFGLKIVRGAYMNEEGRIATEKGLESSICEDLEDTHSNYNRSIEFLFNNYKEGDKFCIATHNLESIKLVGELYKEKGKNDDIFCAQLLGIAEHATGYCQKSDIKVAKYVPFGKFEILIPYLIRRAEESSMIQKLKVQNDLLNEELKLRSKFWKV